MVFAEAGVGGFGGDEGALALPVSGAREEERQEETEARSLAPVVLCYAMALLKRGERKEALGKIMGLSGRSKTNGSGGGKGEFSVAATLGLERVPYVHYLLLCDLC